MTESLELGKHHYCVVHVRETQREFRVEIMDRSYQPMILLIEEGDRVWWSWDKLKVIKGFLNNGVKIIEFKMLFSKF